MLRKPFFFLVLLSIGSSVYAQKTKNVQSNDKSHFNKWFSIYDFKASKFKNPSLEFGPIARWWWPGNDVTAVGLQREINLFADYGFSGVELQTMIPRVGINSENRSKVLGWDSPQYYDNVKIVMEEALKRGLFVDMTNGSGWPPGSSILEANDGFRNLKFEAITVEGGKPQTIVLPKVKTEIGSSILQAVVASKMIGSNEKTSQLDINSSQIITEKVIGDSIKYSLPNGNWKIIAYYSVPSGEKAMAAEPIRGYVVDHFDSTKVLKLYHHLFGKRTGLQPYFGNPMRAVFNDSYEFKTDRHYSADFITWFKKHRGYDPTPYLAANMQKGYNFVEYANPHAPKDFTFNDATDTRLRYDYDLTLSELLAEHFFKTSRSFLENQNLLHKTQAYGLRMDMMQMAGLASIPEMESMLASEANMKIVSSGAHLYNKPLVTAESVVFQNRLYMTTPQKTRIAIDKLFAAGANQVLFHGIPYRYFPEGIGKQGWYPFSSAASHYGEGDIYWKYQKDINAYIQRTQYALRSGKAKSDVLIYLPFMKVEEMPDNPEEIMTMGEMVGIEPPLPKSEQPKGEIATWAEKTWKLINQLEAHGITWEWVNDHSLQTATLTNNKQINIRGNNFQALILSNNLAIPLETAKQLQQLTSQGMKFLNLGDLPSKQLSFLNWEKNDKQVEHLFKSIIKQKNSVQIIDNKQITTWISTLKQNLKFDENYTFTRQIQRELSDGSRIQFIWNKSDKWQTISLSLDKKYKYSQWLNAEDSIITNNGASHKVSYQLAPYSSIILYASTKTYLEKEPQKPKNLNPSNATTLVTIENWDISADTLSIKNTKLFDFKNQDTFKNVGSEIIYKSSFEIQNYDTKTSLILDLGKVYHTAEVYINGKFAGKRIVYPYSLDISSFVKNGKNDIEIRVLPTMLNYFITQAVAGNKQYQQFKRSEGKLMSNGLVGDVKILKVK